PGVDAAHSHGAWHTGTLLIEDFTGADVPASQTSVATLANVTHRYGSIEALSDVTFDLEAGQVTALLGPNGAGKTTIVRLLAGLTRPTKGRAVLFGGDPQSVESRRRLGVML